MRAQVLELLAARLPAVLAPALGPVTIADLRTLSGGASRTTWAFDAVSGPDRRALILRCGPSDDLHASMQLEARAQQAAAAAGAPVPQIVVADDSAAALGDPYLVCGAIAGETIVRRIFRQLDAAAIPAGEPTGRARLLTQCAQALAAIHRADTAAVAGATDGDQLSLWQAELDALTSGGDAATTFEWAFRWLAAHRPPNGPTRLVHGDFRMGNLIVDGTALAAVLDWELVHLGQPAEDLAWFCIRAWRFGAPGQLGAGGLGGIEDFLLAYEAASGTAVDRAEFHWWLVLATLRWGIICRYQAHRHLSGLARSVELATIGRRVAETEWDLLALLAPPGHRAGEAGVAGEAAVGPAIPPPAAPAAAGLYGRPTAAELIEAVTDFLATEVSDATTGSVNFHTRVAANALRIVHRELLHTEAGTVRAADTLATLGFAAEADLAVAIRAGNLDDRAADVTAGLRTLVRQRLAVAHPGYDEG